MSLLHEISSLHGELLAAKTKPPSGHATVQTTTATDKKAEPEAAGQTNVDAQAQTLIRDIEILVDQISQDIEQNPRMTAIAAFGLGLLLGLTLSR